MKVTEAGPTEVEEAVARALREDRADLDRSAQAVVPEGARARATLSARAEGVLAGTAHATETFARCGVRELRWARGDGDAVAPGDVVLEAVGPARGLLAAERTALNFLQQLSGVATAARRAADAAPGLQVLDTRKTVPGLRAAQKDAVAAGGAGNQRRDLADEILLKENHFALSGRGYAETVRAAVDAARGAVVGVEAESVDQARAALEAGADYVLLDNFSLEELGEAVARLRAHWPRAVLEASGGWSVADLPALQATGVDRVSLGALTHSVRALDLSMKLEAIA